MNELSLGEIDNRSMDYFYINPLVPMMHKMVCEFRYCHCAQAQAVIEDLNILILTGNLDAEL